jgi:hypothetical protein
VSIQSRERISVFGGGGGGGQASHPLPQIAYYRHPICMKSLYVRGGEPLAILFFIVIDIVISFNELYGK